MKRRAGSPLHASASAPTVWTAAPGLLPQSRSSGRGGGSTATHRHAQSLMARHASTWRHTLTHKACARAHTRMRTQTHTETHKCTHMHARKRAHTPIPPTQQCRHNQVAALLVHTHQQNAPSGLQTVRVSGVKFLHVDSCCQAPSSGR